MKTSHWVILAIIILLISGTVLAIMFKDNIVDPVIIEPTIIISPSNYVVPNPTDIPQINYQGEIDNNRSLIEKLESEIEIIDRDIRKIEEVIYQELEQLEN